MGWHSDRVFNICSEFNRTENATYYTVQWMRGKKSSMKLRRSGSYDDDEDAAVPEVCSGFDIEKLEKFISFYYKTKFLLMRYSGARNKKKHCSILQR